MASTGSFTDDEEYHLQKSRGGCCCRDPAAEVGFRLSTVITLYIGLLSLSLFSLMGTWYHQTWVIANGSVLTWDVSLWTGSASPDCTSRFNDFVRYCNTLFEHLTGTLSGVSRHVCHESSETSETDSIDHRGMALRVACEQLGRFTKISTASGTLMAMSFTALAVSLLAFITHWRTGLHGKNAYNLSLATLFLSWVFCLIAVCVYGGNLQAIRAMFVLGGSNDYSPSFAPFVARPLHYDAGYALGIAIALCVLVFILIFFFRLCVPRRPLAWQSWYSPDAKQRIIGEVGVRNYGV